MGNFTITAEAGGPSTSGGSVPLAPNVAATWLSAITPVYIAYGNAWKVAGFQGTLTPPTGTDCTYLKQIHIASINPSGFRSDTTLYGPFSVGVGKAFKVETDDLLTVNATYTLEFAAENDDSVVTTPPYTTTVNVVAPSITSVSATDNVGSRYRYGANSIRTVLSFTPTISSGQYPLTVTAWRNEGTGQKWCGWFVVASNGATVQIGAQGSPSEGDIIPPTVSNGSWTLTLAVGAIEKNATIPGSAVTSSAFTVITPPAPSATAATGAYIDQVTYVKGAAGAYTFGWSHLYATLPLSDPNFMFARLTLQTGSGTGGGFVPGGKHAVETSIGDWAADDDHQDNFFRVAGTSQIYCFNPNLWDVPTDGNLTHRFKWYVASRKDDGTGATKVQQSCWSSGVSVSTPGTNAFQEFVADVTKKTIDSTLIDPTTLDPTLVLDPTTGKPRINTGNLSNAVLNPSFENGSVGYSFVGSVTVAAIPSWAYSGNNVCVMQANDTFVRTDYISVRPDDVYYAEVVWRSDGGVVPNGAVDFVIECYDTNKNIQSFAPNWVTETPGDGHLHGIWKVVGYGCTIPVGISYVRLRVHFSGNTNGGVITLDNFGLFRQTPTSRGTVPNGKGGVRLNTDNLTNLVLNGSFENGDLSGWDTIHGTAVVEYAPNAGFQPSGAYRIITTADSGGLAQLVETDRHTWRPGESMYAETYVFSNNSTNTGTAVIAVYYEDAAGGLTGAYFGTTSVRTPGWQQIKVTTPVAPANTATARISIYIQSEIAGRNWYFDGVYAVRQLPTGPGNQSDGRGGIQTKIAGPIYTDVADAVNIRISSDYVVSGGVLTQNIIDLAKSVNFSTEFAKSGGLMTINAIAVNKLIAGDALFAGQATFAYNGGGKVTINSIGLTLANSNFSPTSTVTITSAGVTIANGTNSVQADSGGVKLVQGGVVSVQVDSSRILIQRGSSNVAVAASGVTITNGSLSLTSGSSTINIDGSNYIRLTDTLFGNYATLRPGNISVVSSIDSSVALLTTGNGTGSLRLIAGTGAVTIDYVASSASFANAGGAVLPSNPVGFVGVKINGIGYKIPYYAN